MPGQAADLRTLTDWLNKAPRLYPLVWLRVLLGVMTVVNVVLLFYGLSGGSYDPVLLSIALSWVITGYFSKYVHRQHQQIGHKQAVFEQYADILAVFSGVKTDGSATGGLESGGTATVGSQGGGSGCWTTSGARGKRTGLSGGCRALHPSSISG